jgi:hypothetical protein
MNIDITTTFKVILALVGIALIFTVILGFRSINAGKRLEFYQKRQQLIEQGWRLFLLALVFAVGGFLIFRFGEPIAYHYFPPSPTITRTPTITITPTITLTPQQTSTPTITLTLAQTYTPMIPDVVQTYIKTPVGVDNNAVFSVITFSTQTKDGVVINTVSSFTLPITQMYGGYSFDKMVTGVQWTAVWFYEGHVICFESVPWNFPPGGYGYSDACNKQLTPDQWKPGSYEVQIFVGQTWKTSGRFVILGNTGSTTPLPTSSGSPAPKLTSTPTKPVGP